MLEGRTTFFLIFPFASAVAVASAEPEVLSRYRFTTSVAWKPVPVALTFVPGEATAGLEARPFPSVKLFWVTRLLVTPTTATVYVPLEAAGMLMLADTVPEKPAVTVATLVPVPGPV